MTVGLGAYFIGHAFEQVLGVGGLVAAGVVGSLLVAVAVLRRMRRAGADA